MNENYEKSFNKIGVIEFGLYLDWCKKNDLNFKCKKNKQKFFRLLLDGKLVRDGNQLIKKRVRKNEND